MGKYFKCPSCNSKLEKSALDQVYSKVAGLSLTGSSIEKCPACGTLIDRLAIINGNYDVKWWQFWK